MSSPVQTAVAGAPPRWPSASVLYYGAMLAAGGAGLGKSVGYGLLLAPAEFGHVSLVNSFMPFALLGLGRGLLEGAALELPRLYGEKRPDAAAHVLRQCLGRLGRDSLWALALAAALAALGLPWLVLALAVPMASATGLVSLALTDARSRGDMPRYGGSVLARVVLCAGLGLPAAAWFGWAGAVAGEIIGQLALLAWLWRGLPCAVAAPDVGPDPLPALRGRGRGMMLHQWMQLVHLNGDRWLIGAALGTAAVGQYSFAAILLLAASLVHAMVYQHIGPAALRSLAEGVAPRAVLARTHRAALALGGLFAVAAVAAGAAFWLAHDTWLAEYGEAWRIFPWVALAAVFQVMNQYDWIVASGPNMATLVRGDAVGLVVVFGLGLAGVRAGWPLDYFAALFCAARAGALLLTVVLAHRGVQERRVR